MYVIGKFQAKKLTKTIGKNGVVYRKLWVFDEYEEEFEIPVKEDVIPKLKKDGVYLGTFDFVQNERYEGYGKNDKMTLVDVTEIDKKDFAVTGAWDI